MNFWDRITGNDMTKEMKAFELRAKKLPADYQAAWEKIKFNIWPHTDFTGRNLMPANPSKRSGSGSNTISLR